MSEIVCTYLLNDPFTMVPMERNKFYEEQIGVYLKTGQPSRAVEDIKVLIFSSDGELIIQKRSFEKNHNAGLLDKSIGGHVQEGNTADFTVMLETVQELQTPSVVLKTPEDFLKTLNILHSYLDTIAIICHHKTKLYVLDKIIDGKTIKIANKSNVYFGVYDGRLRPADREAKGMLYYSLPELRQEIVKSPDTFTNDLRTYIEELNPEMEKFISIAKNATNE